MKKQIYICRVCGYIYDPKVGDPEHGIAPGTPLSEVDHHWVCPVCKKGKNFFYLLKRDHDPAYSSVDEADIDHVLLS